MSSGAESLGTYHAHVGRRLYVGLVLPALGMLLVSLPGRDSLVGGDERGVVAAGAGLLAIALLTVRFNRRAYWTVVFHPVDLELRASSRQVRLPYNDVEVIEQVTWPPIVASHLRLLTSQGRHSVPHVSDQEGFIAELRERCTRASLRE